MSNPKVVHSLTGSLYVYDPKDFERHLVEFE